ncbi:MAG TPA: hypothetical protein VGK73_35675 [Polyangiaceae bacterium]
MASRLRYWFAGSALLVVGACSGSSTRQDDDDPGAGTSGSATSGAAGAGRGGSGSAGKGSGGSSAGTASGGRAGSGSGGLAGKGGAGSGTGGVSGTSGGLSAGAAGAGEGGDGSGGTGGEAGGGGVAGAPGGRWENCPTATDYAGDDSWPNTVEVTESATYCATFAENRTLKEELAQKALLRVAPGTYHLPPDTREGLGLPLCIAYGPEGKGVGVSPVSVAYSATPLSSDVSHRYEFEALVSDPDRSFSTNLWRTLPGGEAFRFTLDGGEGDMETSDAQIFAFALCQGLGDPCYGDRIFDSCTHAGSTLHRHEIALEDGELVLDLRIGTSSASTEPGAFVRASGTFREQSFDQTDYFRLIYNPTHHHFERDFAVLFDAPIDGVCGIEVTDFAASEETPPNAFAVDCALERLETLGVVNFSLTRDP